ncbi:MAG: hypothetical protein PHU23_08875 [Dehalococcoidales bacterium]|nr:hypothetical protein [Dehalococcoidales bacterium]
MAETKYGKYIITDANSHLFQAPGEKMEKGESVIVLNLDDSNIKGAPLLEGSWLMPADLDKQVPLQPHCHDFDEILVQFGTDPKNPHDLGAEIEIWLGGEKHIITKSCIIFIPKGLEHGPARYNRMDKPVIHFAVGLGREYK